MRLKNLGLVFLSLLMVSLLAFGIYLMSQFSQPLGPTMSLHSSGGAPDAQVGSSPVVMQSSAATDITATPAPQSFCSQTGKMVILVIGDDSNPNIDPPGSDLVRYVQIDFSQQKVTIFTFPRGLWLNTPVLADQKIDATTLGKSYHFAILAIRAKGTEQDEKKQIVLASQAVAQTVLDNFGLTPDHYVAVKLGNLPKLADAVGGVTIDNPARLITTYDPPFTFEVGPQTLNGLQIASYVRFADATHSDWDRSARQNLVLQALYKKLEDPANLTKIPTFFSQLADSIVTDLSAENVTDLTCVLKSVGISNIIQESVRPEMVTNGPEPLSQLPDIDKITALLKSIGMLP